MSVQKRVMNCRFLHVQVALFPAAVSPPRLYATAVMKLYVQHEVGGT